MACAGHAGRPARRCPHRPGGGQRGPGGDGVGCHAPFNTVNAIDYGLIALYFFIVIWVGFYSARKNKGTRDFFEAGGLVPWFMAGVANWVAGFSAFVFVAAAIRCPPPASRARATPYLR